MNTFDLAVPSPLAAKVRASEGAPSSRSPAVAGGVRAVLRAEALLVLAMAITLYARGGYSGWLFAALFLVPDLSLLGYLAGARAGAAIYNAAHSLAGPLSLGLVAVFAAPWLSPYALIWLAHVGFDRALGYGLKYGTAFGHTHLGRIGRAREA